MNLTEVSSQQFQNAQLALVNILQQYDQNIDTKKASTVRQLVIRPFAFIYTKVQQLLDDWLEKTSVRYLSQSAQTDNQIADIVASNYFVTRNQGGYARGIVTLTCSTESVRIPFNSQFSIDNRRFHTEDSVVATTTPEQDTQYITYSKMYLINGKYVVNIPVVAMQPGNIQIPVGAQVVVLSNIANIIDAQLTSPVTGGYSVQTDAQMMQRCKARCGAAIGTLSAYKIKMEQAPVSVFSCNALGGNQPSCFRSRHNNLDIPFGGVVDLYVKTANQPSVKVLQCVPVVSDDGNTSTVQLDAIQYSDIYGLLRVTGVSVSQGESPEYSVIYSSRSTDINDKGARLSSQQKVTIHIQGTPQSVFVTVQYLPGVYQIQKYIDSYQYAYLGQDCLVKSAVPVSVSIQGNVYSAGQISQDTLQELKLFISQQVNNIPVGEYQLNMSRIAESVEFNFPGIKMRLPYTIQAAMPMTNGGTYTFNSVNGILDLSFRDGLYMWDKYACFFTTTPSQVALEVAFR